MIDLLEKAERMIFNTIVLDEPLPVADEVEPASAKLGARLLSPNRIIMSKQTRDELSRQCWQMGVMGRPYAHDEPHTIHGVTIAIDNSLPFGTMGIAKALFS